MNNLLYKEYKLLFQPVYLLIFLFPFLLIAPSNLPIYSCFVSMVVLYCSMFMGIKNGVSTNDLLFTLLLPVKKKDIIFAKLILCTILHFLFIGMLFIVYFLGKLVGLSSLYFNQFLSIICLGIISFSVFDLCFFSIYYRKAKSPVLPTMLGGIIQFFFLKLSIDILPKKFVIYKKFIFRSTIANSILIVVATLIIYALLHSLILKISLRKFEKINF